MQSKTRWNCPPPDPMLTSAQLDVMPSLPGSSMFSAGTGAGFGLLRGAISKPLLDVFVRGAAKWSAFFAATQDWLRPARNTAIR
jgi:hypothetical protein